jgi:hypothetical protein
MTEKVPKSLKFAGTDDSGEKVKAKDKRNISTAAKHSTDDNDLRRSTLFSTLSPRRSRYSISVRPVVKYQNTYRLDSKNPFDFQKCLEILENIMTKNVPSNCKFDNRQTERVCHGLKEEILSQLKDQEFDRYRLIVMISFGEKFHQSCRSASKFLWDPEKDVVVTYTHETPNVFISALILGIYYE